ncbi:hypothetical protein ANN_17051 [Periplaneta americana]|uniref:Uncharacterized protein n=1 Tax=Periplaneta americana TaxID=6978 RepID=A0ABQ8SRT7_PERAM|nr:hypothetical protein ANN_17051 [Periplaneta americana]
MNLMKAVASTSAETPAEIIQRHLGRISCETDARTCKLVSKSETEVTGGQEGRKEARRTGNMCPGVELTDEGMYGLCLRVVSKMTHSKRDDLLEEILRIACNVQISDRQKLCRDRCLRDYESIKPKLMYDRNLDMLIGMTDTENNAIGIEIILPVILYGCETWTLTLREEQRLRVFENKVLRKIFGAKRDEVTGEWRKLHNAELHALHPSPDIIRNIKSRRLRWTGHVALMGESRNAYRVLVGGPEGKRPLGSPRRRWEDNIKMDLREVGYDGRDWINLAQDRDQWRAYVRTAMNLRITLQAPPEAIGSFDRPPWNVAKRTLDGFCNEHPRRTYSGEEFHLGPTGSQDRSEENAGPSVPPQLNSIPNSGPWGTEAGMVYGFLSCRDRSLKESNVVGWCAYFGSVAINQTFHIEG